MSADRLKNLKKTGLRGTVVLIDFDNTITISDVLDDIIKRFSVDNGWVELEKAWVSGKIGSKECLKGQLASVSVTRPALAEYLSSVSIDP
ncbi:MAG: hypothetical protein HQL28_06355, partial [Candidatus Omnitrophica bacterium]|nr:hypothetical protein [Candidatus Omnitrophota bacterium]